MAGRGTSSRRRLGTAGTGAAGVVLTAAMLTGLPLTAAAQDRPEVLDGDCRATLRDDAGNELRDDTGNPLTVDAGALVNLPGVADVGLGTGPGQDKPLLSLPAAQVAKALGLVRLPVVGNVTVAVCETAQAGVNTLAAPVQDVAALVLPLPPDEEPPPPPEEPAPPPEPPTEPPPAPPPEPPPPPPGGPGPGDSAPGTAFGPILSSFGAGQNPLTRSFAGIGSQASPFASGSALAALPPLTVGAPNGPLPNVPPALGPVPIPQLPEAPESQAGIGQPMPAAGAPNRVPLMFALLAVAIVAAALVRTWRRRAS